MTGGGSSMCWGVAVAVIAVLHRLELPELTGGPRHARDSRRAALRTRQARPAPGDPRLYENKRLAGYLFAGNYIQLKSHLVRRCCVDNAAGAQLVGGQWNIAAHRGAPNQQHAEISLGDDRRVAIPRNQEPTTT